MDEEDTDRAKKPPLRVQRPPLPTEPTIDRSVHDDLTIVAPAGSSSSVLEAAALAERGAHAADDEPVTMQEIVPLAPDSDREIAIRPKLATPRMDLRHFTPSQGVVPMPPPAPSSMVAAPPSSSSVLAASSFSPLTTGSSIAPSAMSIAPSGMPTSRAFPVLPTMLDREPPAAPAPHPARWLIAGVAIGAIAASGFFLLRERTTNAMGNAATGAPRPIETDLDKLTPPPLPPTPRASASAQTKPSPAH